MQTHKNRHDRVKRKQTGAVKRRRRRRKGKGGGERERQTERISPAGFNKFYSVRIGRGAGGQTDRQR